MKSAFILLALLALANCQGINSMTFKSFPDNEDSNCVFVITLADDNYATGSPPDRSITSGAQAGYIGYAEVFWGKDESNPVDGNSDLSCTYTLVSLGSDNMDEQFHINDNGCTIYNDYEEEFDEVLEGDIYLERYNSDEYREQLIITVVGQNEQWDGWLNDAESDDFQVCYINLAEDGYDWTNKCTYQSAAPEFLACGQNNDKAQPITSAILGVSLLSMF